VLGDGFQIYQTISYGCYCLIVSFTSQVARALVDRLSVDVGVSEQKSQAELSFSLTRWTRSTRTRGFPDDDGWTVYELRLVALILDTDVSGFSTSETTRA
jgi:hypothetical protein